MALAIDGSSPAIVTQTNNTIATLTTGSFTPPAGSLLLVLWSADALTNPSAPSITDSLGVPLTYTLTDWKNRADASPTVFGQCAAWTAPVGAGGTSMTVTVTSGAVSGDRTAALCVLVITGADTSSPQGVHNKSGSTSASTIAQNYTAQATNGWGFICVCDFDGLAAQSAGTGCTLIGSATVATSFTYGFVRRTSADDVNGNTNTLNVTIGGTSTNLNWVYVEIKPAAAGGGSPPPMLMPPHLLLEFMGAFAELGAGSVVAVPTTADTGLSSAGGASYGTAASLRARSGTSAAGVAALATAVKKVAQTGLCAAGGATRAVALKLTARIGSVSAGAAAQGTAVKKTAQTGLVAAGPSGFGPTQAARAKTGLVSAGAATLATGVKVAPQTGRAEAGAAALAAQKKVATPVALSFVGGSVRGTAVHKGQPLGVGAAGGVGRVVQGSIRARTGSGLGGVGGQGVALAKHPVAGRGVAALAGYGTAVQPAAFIPILIGLDDGLTAAGGSDGILVGPGTDAGLVSAGGSDATLVGHTTDGGTTSSGGVG